MFCGKTLALRRGERGTLCMAMVLKLWRVSESSGRLIKADYWPHSQNCRLSGGGVEGPENCMFQKFLNGADAAAPGTTF